MQKNYVRPDGATIAIQDIFDLIASKADEADHLLWLLQEAAHLQRHGANDRHFEGAISYVIKLAQSQLQEIINSTIRGVAQINSLDRQGERHGESHAQTDCNGADGAPAVAVVGG